MQAYESGHHKVILVFFSVPLQQAIDIETVYKSAKENISSNIAKGLIDPKSHVEQGLKIDGLSAVLTELYSDHGKTRLQTFELLLTTKAKIKHAVAILDEGVTLFEEEKVKKFIASIKIEAQL